VLDHAVGFAVGARSMTPTSRTVSPAATSAPVDAAASLLSTTTTMPSPQLKVRSMSSVGTLPASLQPDETPAAPSSAGIEPRAQAVGQAARHVAGQAAAGDVGQALDRVVPRIACSSGFT
jgi:hypothetical protein